MHNPTDFSAGNKKKKLIQEKVPFETRPPLDQPAGVIKQIQGALNLHPAFRLELTQTGHEHNKHMPRMFFCWCATHNPWSDSRTPHTAAELFCWLSPDPVDFTTSEPGKCKVDSQSKAGGNRRQELREVLQGEALTHSQ